MVINFDLKAENDILFALGIIKKRLQKLLDGDNFENHFNIAKNWEKNRLELLIDNAGETAWQFINDMENYAEHKSISHLIKIVSEITKESIMETAKSIFKISNMFLRIEGNPTKKLKEEILTFYDDWAENQNNAVIK